MSPEKRLVAANAFWTDEHGHEQQVEVIVTLARKMNFRPKSVPALPLERRAKLLAGMDVSDAVASRALIAYHLAAERPMMGAFLDLLGIAHEDGLIKDEEPKKPEDATLDKAVKELSGKFPKQDVARYFWALLWQDPETWAGLKGRPELAID